MNFNIKNLFELPNVIKIPEMVSISLFSNIIYSKTGHVFCVCVLEVVLILANIVIFLFLMSFKVLMFVIMILQRCGNEGKPLWFLIPAGINALSSHIPGLQNYDTEIFGHLVVYGFIVFTGLQTICIILNERAPIQVI